MKSFKINHHPAGMAWGKHPYPEHFSLTLICSRGLRWDGGDFPTLEAATEAAKRKAA